MVMFSRSLATSLWYRSRIEERTLAFAQALAMKLRRKEVRAGTLSLSYSGGYTERGKYRRSSESLAMPSNDTRDILSQVHRLMNRLLSCQMDFGVKRIALTPKQIQQMHGRQENRSPRYTTRWSDVLVVDIS